MTVLRNRLLSRVTAPASEPLTLTEAKLYLRIDGNTEDTLVGDLIVAARMNAEMHMKRSLITQSWKLSYDDSISDEVSLPMGPVNGITSVTVIARSGSSQAIASTAYFLNAAKDKLILTTPIFGAAMADGTRVEIIYSTGYGDASAVPKPIKFGMLSHMASMYDNRGEPEDGIMPPQTMRFYAPFREICL